MSVFFPHLLMIMQRKIVLGLVYWIDLKRTYLIHEFFCPLSLSPLRLLPVNKHHLVKTNADEKIPKTLLPRGWPCERICLLFDSYHQFLPNGRFPTLWLVRSSLTWPWWYDSTAASSSLWFLVLDIAIVLGCQTWAVCGFWVVFLKTITLLHSALSLHTLFLAKVL